MKMNSFMRMDRDFRSVALPKQRRGRSRREGNMKTRVQRLKWEMSVLRVEQQEVKKEQKDIKKKMEKVGAECARLREETELMSRQSYRRLGLVFQILEARKKLQHGQGLPTYPLSPPTEAQRDVSSRGC